MSRHRHGRGRRHRERQRQAILRLAERGKIRDARQNRRQRQARTAQPQRKR